MIDPKQYIRSIQNFPKPGIMFRDITPLLSHPDAFRETVRRIVQKFRDQKIDVVAAAEARGFIFATASCWSTTCWRRAERSMLAPSWSNAEARRWSDVHSRLS